MSAKYKGTAVFEKLDAATHTAEISAKGQDLSGRGGADMKMTSGLKEQPNGETEVTLVSDVNVTGILAQFGRGLMQDVSDQMLKRFTDAMRAELEKPDASEVAAAVKDTMERLSQRFPDGIVYAIPYDTTRFIQASIEAVISTFVEAIVLVVLVVFLFLQNVRATIIPVLAVPVSIIGAFAGMYLLGFSINLLTLFGLILASLVNLFWPSSALSFAISVIGVIVFAGLTAWDTQKIKEMYDSMDDDGTLGRKAVMGALSLYLDFINLFVMLMQLLGVRRD